MTGPTPEIAIRAAARADFGYITQIYADHVRTGTASFELDPPDVAEMRRRWREVRKRGLPYLVAMVAGHVAGYAYAGSYRPRPAYRFTVEDSVYVHADAMGRGIGRALLAALIRQCEQAGARQMLAVIGDGGNTASIRLHAAAGFAPAGTLSSVGYKFGRWLDVVIMQRALGVGDAAPPVA
jgi:L-amino acid N-acyltransferase YncA